MRVKKHHSFAVGLNVPIVKETTAQHVRTPEDVARIMSGVINWAQEGFFVLSLNTRYNLIDRHLITLGLVNATLVHPREIFRPILVDGASAFVLTHNHPSGDPTPSAEDLRLTRQIIETAKVVDIECLDHVILGRGGEKPFVSLRESGLCNFSK